jgi:hypothetical protein
MKRAEFRQAVEDTYAKSNNLRREQQAKGCEA